MAMTKPYLTAPRHQGHVPDDVGCRRDRERILRGGRLPRPGHQRGGGSADAGRREIRACHCRGRDRGKARGGGQRAARGDARKPRRVGDPGAHPPPAEPSRTRLGQAQAERAREAAAQGSGQPASRGVRAGDRQDGPSHVAAIAAHAAAQETLIGSAGRSAPPCISLRGALRNSGSPPREIPMADSQRVRTFTSARLRAVGTCRISCWVS